MRKMGFAGSQRRSGIAAVLVLVTAALLGITGAALGEETEAPRETAMPVSPLLDLPELTEGSLVEFPVEEAEDMQIFLPREENYLTPEGEENPTGYADPSITVNFGTGRIYETNYMTVRVKVASANQLRAMLASPVTSRHTRPGHELAKRVGAVLAINGDFCGGTGVTKGVIMRQGDMKRKKIDGHFDILVIDRAGDFHILLNATTSEIDAIEANAVNIFTFGPGLVIDGEPQYGVKNNLIGSHKKTQRLAFCQTGPLEYLIVACEGPSNEGSQGLTIDEFVDLVSSIPGVQNAYNLDGGSSSTIVFRRDGNNWLKVNALSNPKVRPLKDIIYFVSAWDAPEPTPTPEPTEEPTPEPTEALTEEPAEEPAE